MLGSSADSIVTSCRGAVSYLPDPVPERVVLLFVSPVDVPAVLPTPCALLDAAPTFVPVVPCIPTVGELVAEPVGAPAAVLFGEEVLLGGGEDCASAVPESASAKADAISLMCCPPLVRTTRSFPVRSETLNAFFSATEAVKPACTN
jgi:hypothetical protein